MKNRFFCIVLGIILIGCLLCGFNSKAEKNESHYTIAENFSNVKNTTQEVNFTSLENLSFSKGEEIFQEIDTSIPTLVIRNSKNGSYLVQAKDESGNILFEEDELYGNVEQVMDYTFDKIFKRR